MSEVGSDMAVGYLTKVSFHANIRILKGDLYGNAYAVNEDHEDSWLKGEVGNTFKLEDSFGKTLRLDDIFVEGRLPRNTPHGSLLKYVPDNLLQDIQRRDYSLYMTSSNTRIKLINPIIVNLEKTYTVNPLLNGRFENNSNSYIDLKFEILCDKYLEVPMCDAATIKKVMRSIIKKNLLIPLVSRHEMLTIQATVAEMKARASLRDMLAESQWGKYVTNGFIMVQGNSKKWYQIFMKQKHVRVYDKGKFIKELCIHTAANEVPPTDHVLNLKIMVECDEQAVWDNSNPYDPTAKSNRIIQEDSESLIDALSKLKKDNHFLENRVERQRQRSEDDFFREYA